MKYKNPIVFILCMLGFYNLYAGNPTAVKPVRTDVHPGGQFINYKDWNFVENKGQLNASDIKYYGHQGGVYLYCKPGMIEFVFTKAEKENDATVSEATGLGVETGPLSLHARQQRSPLSALRSSFATLILLNSNPSARIIASDQQEYYENYYTANTPEEGITNVHTYKTITYKEIYPNIDMVLHCKESGLKYEFVVNPGGRVSDIQMQWEGIEGIKKMQDFGIEYSCSLGKMTESAPYTYQGMANQIESQFILKNNIIGFKTAAYDKTKPLVIDPTLVWGTYLGGDGTDEGFGVATDKAGNVYISGITTSTNGIATSGTYQTSFSGSSAYFLAKFNSKGTVLWATYYSGSNAGGLYSWGNGKGVTTDLYGNVYISGSIGDSGYATSGAYQTSYGGDGDAFLAKFNSNGIRQWATYYGGYEQDYGIGVICDASGDVYITGQTNSPTSIATRGAYLTSFEGGNYAAFIAKFNGNGAIIWATYYGGNEETDGYCLTVDGSGNVYIAGLTADTGIATTGAYQTSFPQYWNGSHNAFLVKFNKNGARQWGTYYGGNSVDAAVGVATDDSGNVYITGSVDGDSGIATAGAYQTSFGGMENAFLAKFNTNGGIQWGTYFGGSGVDNGIGIATDTHGNVYISGTTSSKMGIASYGAYQASYGGGLTDAFLASFNSNGIRLWSTYFGFGYTVVAQDIATDISGKLYIMGLTTIDSSIITKGTHQILFGGGNYDVFLAKFGNPTVNDAGISSILKPKNYFCSDTQAVDVQLHNYGTSNLDSVTINLSSNGKTISVYHWKGNLLPDSSVSVSIGRFLFPVGKDTLKFWTSNPNGVIDSVPENDTSTGIVTVLAPPIVQISPAKSICTNTSDTIGTIAVVSDSYSWTSSPAGFHSSSPRTVVSPSIKTTYYVTVTSQITGCSNSDSVTISLIPLPQVNTGPAETICEDSVVTIGATSMNGYSYSWTSNPMGFSSTVSKPYITPLKTTIYYLTVTDNTTGCSNSDSVIITVNPAPPVDAGTNATICAGSSTVIGDTASKAYSYSWTSNPSGFSSTTSEPTVSPKISTNYTLIVTNPKTGCSSFRSVYIDVNPLPIPGIDSTHYTICTGSHIAIGIMAQPDIAYSWTSQPAGFTSTQSNPIVNPAGNTVYFLTETNTKTGCSSNDSSKVTVTIPKAPVSSPGFNQTICYGNIAVLGADPLAGITYSWTSGPPGFTSSSPKAGVKPDTTTTYYLTVKNSIGCTDLGAVTVKVNPLPVVNAGLPQTVCSGTAVQLGSSPLVGDSYSWTSLPTGFQSNISNPVDTPNVTTKYYVKRTIDSTGCSNSDSMKITVAPRPNVLFNVKNLNGFEYQFNVINPNYPSWQYHWSFGDMSSTSSDTGSGYTASHTYTQNGTYKVYLTISLPGLCTEIDSYLVVIDEQFGLNIFPNPFGLQTDINYTLVNPGHVRISLVDELGQQLGTLLDEQLNQGEYNTYFDATLWHTRPAMYFVLFQLDDKLFVKKIIQIGDSY